LLESAKQETDKVQLRLKSLDLAQLIKGVIATNTALARKKQQNIIFQCNNDSCIIFGDHRRLSEVMDNLLNNAIKYSPSSKNIYVSVKLENEKAVIEIKDEGPGLTKDDMKNLFRQFTSLSAEPTGGESSTGLGLSIVKNLVEAHGGKISAVSHGIGKGASFIVELPLSED
ncbi:MAG TPA: HAMP domain-containing sensor histidine kinase, partial [Salinimicrobium sp.]|nr:HAMP domain-containing sensor histidine kinase [Salinimicrobium sp.]